MKKMMESKRPDLVRDKQTDYERKYSLHLKAWWFLLFLDTGYAFSQAKGNDKLLLESVRERASKEVLDKINELMKGLH